MGLLGWALIFLVVALVAGALGFRGAAGAAATIAKVLFGIFLLVFIVLLIMSFLGGRATAPAVVPLIMPSLTLPTGMGVPAVFTNALALAA